jgi:hypothetical protein
MTHWAKQRFGRIEHFMRFPYETQTQALLNLLQLAKNTHYGIKYNFKHISNYNQFKNNVPVVSYEDIQPQINQCMQGQQNVFWHENIYLFAKSSGTTGHKSKYIPVSPTTLHNCHYQGGRDMLTLYSINNQNSKLFTGKNLALGGSIHNNGKVSTGDLSAIIMQNLPAWAQYYRSPNIEIAVLDNWEQKLQQLYASCIKDNIVSLSGVPSWMLVLCKYVMEQSGIKNVHELWPNVEVFFNGGINFLPYQTQFKQFFPKPTMRYYQLYSASEGFFAIQDSNNYNDMLLMLDYGIFYEFATIDTNGDLTSNVVMLDGVSLHTCYALIITTNSGLWRYNTGDTVLFTSLKPHRIKIAGRTKNFINAFGEELMIHNADNALDAACLATGAIIKEYTAAPLYMNNNNKARHDWLIEFEKLPANITAFTLLLDTELKKLNSDYEAKRTNNLLLQLPHVTVAKPNTFITWLMRNNKLGGQYKIPRLSNLRNVYEELLRINTE